MSRSQDAFEGLRIADRDERPANQTSAARTSAPTTLRAIQSQRDDGHG